ncbi:MAG: DUF2971 domain-containing protein [Rhodoplanes sp.]
MKRSEIRERLIGCPGFRYAPPGLRLLMLEAKGHRQPLVTKMHLTTAAKLRVPHLYHYQAFNVKYLREVIVGGTLHFSKPSDFNDPWDCRPWYDFDGIADPEILEQHVQWYVGVSQKHRPDISIEQVNERANFFRQNPPALTAKIREFSQAMGDAINAQYRVYCLSTKSDCELMWAHYAQKHQGICLEFSVANELFCTAFPVQYALTYPHFFMTDHAGPEQQIAPLLSKSSAWNYEDEFRLISDEKGDPKDTIVTTAGKKDIPSKSLTAVILGCLAPDSTKQSIIQMIAESRHRPALKRAVRMRNQYKLMIADEPV